MKIVPVPYKKLARVIELAGGQLTRDSRHLCYWIKGCKRPIIIPKHNPVPVFVILNCLRTAGIDWDNYFKLLKKYKKQISQTPTPPDGNFY